MRCEQINVGDYQDLIWQWFENLPDFAKDAMNRRTDSKAELIASLHDGLNFMVFGGENPLMLVTCIEKLRGAFDTHLLCARRITEKDLFEGMRLVKMAMFARSDVGMLVFDFLSAQKRMKKCLELNGCEFSGQFYIENNRRFELWILQKSLKTFAMSAKFNSV